MFIYTSKNEQIYCIYKVSNQFNNKLYIGFTKDFDNRKSEHKSYSKSKCSKNYNSKFYKALRKYGFENFNFEIIYQSTDYYYCINVMETYFIELYNSYKNGYNSTKGGEGFNVDKIYKEYQVINPEGNIITITNLKEFCSENNLVYELMKNVVSSNNKTKQHKGFKNLNYPEYIPKEKALFKFLNPNNEYIEVENLKQFCLDNNLSYDCMLRVNSGKTLEHKGFKHSKYYELERVKTPSKYSNTISKKENLKINISKLTFENLKVKDITGNIIEIKNLEKFCIENQLNLNSMYKLCSGKIDKHNIYYNLNYNKKIYKCYKDNKLLEIYNLKEYCKINNLSYSTMLKLCRNSNISYNDYRSIVYNKNKDIQIKLFEFYDNNLNVIQTKNLRQFCIENNLSYSAMNKLINGAIPYHKGYRNINCKNYQSKLEIIYKFLSPEKDIVLVYNMNSFCDKNNLNSGKMNLVYNNKIKHHKGWTKYH